MSEKRTKMLTVWVTPDEHQAMLERCNQRQLASWIRDTCLDVRKPRARKIPNIDPQLLRALSGIGNNVNQIARSIHRNAMVSPVRSLHALTELAAIERQLKALRQEFTGDDS